MPETSTQVKQIRYLGDKKVPLKELRKEFYKIRKFEIQNLWQRSIFLITFIVILITGYANLIEKLLLERDKWLTNSDFSDIYIHVICCILAILGFIFSSIWIMMAKGSKAWYEIYENRICQIEKELQVRAEYKMQPGAPWTLDNSFLSTAPGTYSVSRINIMLGQILLFIFGGASCIHIGCIIGLILTDTYKVILTTILTISTFLILFFPIGYFLKRLKSLAHSKGIITPEEEEENAKKIQQEQSFLCDFSFNVPKWVASPIKTQS